MSTVEYVTTAGQLFQASGLGRCELLRGELIMMSPAGSRHGEIALAMGAITVYRNRGDAVILKRTDTLTDGDLLPGFSVPVAEVFTA